jgi:hypothetical protein
MGKNCIPRRRGYNVVEIWSAALSRRFCCSTCGLGRCHAAFVVQKKTKAA